MMEMWPALSDYAKVLTIPEKKESLFFYDTGSPGANAGLPVIFIHGLGDEADSWRHLIPLVSGKSRVIALDLPGFGRSRAGGKINLKRHAEAVLEMLELTGPAVLAGSSMGAIIAEMAALQRPEKAAGLLLLDGCLPASGRAGASMLLMALPVAGKRWYKAFRKNPEGAYNSLRPYYTDLDALPDPDRVFLKKRVMDRVNSQSQFRAYFSSLRSLVAAAAVRNRSFSRKIADYPGKIYLGWGDQDMIMPRDSADAIKAARPDSQMCIFAGAGHLPHQENAPAVAEFLLALISGAEPNRK
ncbi:alpha/beta hydrolase [Brucepastera parasyntrophica]|uniref:alpha/beta fold hydrolase n=1 Tax=Brucepastera parasyntrophica TaxID=2880008 RepID=UPI00210CF74B|nr:alpha/beta hydrolase [Brucepastera parasyntrophica]ULQ60232.1 alpha/beta hydrolase [Brucepastera parasyntrophica]